MSSRNGAGGVAAPIAPRLFLDTAIAAGILCAFGILTRHALTPDGVAYLENAELFATGGWREALQGYWSPGFSLLLAPVVRMVGGDRARLLLIAHVVQVMLGVIALGLAAFAVRRRIPVHAQRVVYWGCAWVILRWLTQEVLTPDLLLCVLLLWHLSLGPARTTRARVLAGILAGAAFLVKTSIWPWLLVAVALMALRSLRARSWMEFPATTVAVAVAIAGTLVVPLSVRAGYPTLGSVGPLNTRWYLGDRSRRTPDIDRGPHAAKRLLEVRPGVVVAAYDLRPSERTYAPWSDPERWAEGVPASSRSPLNLDEALISWRQNGGELARSLLPLVVGLILLVAWTVETRGRGTWWRDRPLLAVGACAALMFAVVHAEHRLLAPAGLLLLFGAWGNPGDAAPRPHFAWPARLLVACVAVQLVTYLPAAALNASRTTEYEESFQQVFTAARARSGARDVVVAGPFGLWMSILWRNQLRAAVQIGAPGERALAQLPDAEVRRLLRAEFGTTLLGVASLRVRQPRRRDDYLLEFLEF